VHRDKILESAQVLGVLEQTGFEYSNETFDDLFIRGFHDNLISIKSESSDDEEEFDGL
jgi:hypothetical protein